MKPIRISPIVSLILLAASLATLPACGSSQSTTASSGAQQSTGTGSVVFTSVWDPPPVALAASRTTPLGPSPAPSAPAIDICVDYGIDTVSMQVLSGANVVAESSFPCGAHVGTLNDVPVGSNLVLRLQGSVGGTVLWRGNSDNTITVNPGKTTDAGKVTVGYIGNDNVAPTIVSVSPDNNAKNIPNASTLRIQFSERMAINTVIDNGSIRIVDDTATPVSGTVAYNSAENTALFTPASPLASGGRYTVSVSPAVTDMAGHPLPGPYVSNFTVHTAGTFVRPALIESYDGVSTAPMGIVGDPLGNAMVVGEIRGTPELLWYNRFDATRKEWDVSARIPRESFAPLAMGVVKPVSDNTGNALLLFEYTVNNIDMTLVAKEYDAVLGWDRNIVLLAGQVKAVSVTGPSGTTLTGGHVDIAENEVGNAIAVWVVRSVSGVESLWGRRFLSGVGWEPAATQLAITNEVNGSLSYPKAAINARGDMVVVWGEYSGSTTSLFSVHAIRYMPGAGWEGSSALLDNQARNPVPSVVMDSNGNSVSIWRRDAGEVMASSSASGQGWGVPLPISGTDRTTGPTAMDIGVDGVGRVVAVWVDTSVSPPRLKACRFSPGTGWGSGVVVSEAAGGSPDYSVNAAGQGVVVYLQAIPPMRLSAVLYDGNTDSWGSVLTVDDSSATGYLQPFAFVDPAGVPHIAWGWANNNPPNTFASWVE